MLLSEKITQNKKINNQSMKSKKVEKEKETSFRRKIKPLI